VLFPTPKSRVLELLKPTAFRARLEEPPVPGDPRPARPRSSFLPITPIRPTVRSRRRSSTSITEIAKTTRSSTDSGISVKGAIVIARYGGGWRGVKPKVAAEHGAVGCIIFSDPKGDGYFEGEQYLPGAGAPRTESNGAASWTRSIRAIR